MCSSILIIAPKSVFIFNKQNLHTIDQVSANIRQARLSLTFWNSGRFFSTVLDVRNTFYWLFLACC